MKKRKSILIVCGALALMQTNPVMAESFEGREDEMNKRCALVYDTATQQECIAYKEYLVSKSNTLDNELAGIQGQLKTVKDDINAIGKLIATNTQQMESITQELATIQININTSLTSIKTLNARIKTKQASIDIRDKQMKDRIIAMQPYVGSNNFIDFLMGATSFTDLLRRTAIVGELQSYDSDQIAILNKEKTELTNDKKDVENKKELLELQKKEAINKKEKQAALKQVNEQLLEKFQHQEAELTAQKRKAQLASGEAANAIPNVSTSVLPPSFEKPGKPSDPSKPNDSQGPSLSTNFVNPLKGNYYVSAGTWQYPGGAFHAGLDLGTMSQMGLQVVAPASGVVMATYDGVPNHPVNWNYVPDFSGIPSGGGNTLSLLTEVNGTVYSFSFFHLSPGMFNVKTGDIVSQGQLLAHSGNSGNSTGPHLHIEVVNLGNIGLKAAMNLFNTTGKDYAYGTGWSAGDLNACGYAPCRERPEKFF